MIPSSRLQVTSHIGRDLLQSAALFKHEWLVAWEYVSNGLQYVEPGTDPIVRVIVDRRSKTMIIRDNGRGMSWDDLANYFVMHGENLDRKQGRPGRGYFGTGKSAAFGIAHTLRVRTIRNHLRSTVELHRHNIERVPSGAPIPIQEIERNVETDESNGTEVTISGIYLKSLDQDRIVRFLERQIAKWPRATVYVNTHLCEYIEPPVGRTFVIHPDDEPFKSSLGKAELVIKVSKRPLEEWEQGISIISNGVLFETTLAGSEKKEMAHYIFGELDVPVLSKDSSPIPAFDMSRSMKLNTSNELVQRILAFIGLYVEQVRRSLVDEDRKRRATEDARRLEREAKEIAKIINSDFEAFRRDLAKMVALASGGTDQHLDPDFLQGDDIGLVPGQTIPARITGDETGIGGSGGGGGEGLEPATAGPALEATDKETATEQADEVRTKTERRSRGGFQVEFRNLGEDQPRAKYDRETRTIFVNLDHPQLVAAIGVSGIDDIAFKRLSYEIAFAEYSIALAVEMIHAQHFIDLFEPLTVARETLNRVARNAAALYRPAAGSAPS